MSRGVNKVILVGNIGQDPEVRYLPNGGAVANVNLATSESWTDKNSGQKQEKTEWHRIVFFGKLAEIVSQYVKKGSKLYVEGKLQTRKWQDQAGNDKYTTEIVVDGFSGQMQMLDGAGGNGNNGGGNRQSQQPQQNYQHPMQQPQVNQVQQQPMQQPAAQPSPMAQNPTGQQYNNRQQENWNQQQAPSGGDEFRDDIPFAQYMKNTFI